MTSSAISVRLALTAALAGLCACGPSADPAPVPVADSAKASPRMVTETVTVRDKDLEQRVSRLELTLLERDAQVEDLQNRLEETRREVVRSMAKVQTLATRAEAASGMAEAEIALQTLRRSSRGSGGGSADVARVSKLLQDATNEFNKQNYGGALYLANQAKSTAGVGRTRSSGGDVSSLRPGEVPFAVPLDLQVTARCKLRDGPGTTYRVLATLESGASLSGVSHVDQWVRVSTDSGTTGWVFWNLVQRRADPGNR